VATEDRTDVVVDNETRGVGATNGNPLAGDTGLGVEGLKAKVAAKRRGGAAGKQAMVQASAHTVGGTEDVPAPVPSDAGTPDNELTPEANDELARLASIREAEAEAESEAEEDDEDTEAAVMKGLQEDGGGGEDGGVEGETLYARRQREIAAAKARPGGKASKSGKGKGGSGAVAKEREKAKAKAATLKERAAAAKAREKEKAKEKTEKQKEREKAAKAKESAEVKKEREAERKAKAAEKADAKRKERALRMASIPALAKANAALKAAFAEDYALAGPKTERNPNGLGIRRAKADRGDFAAGYVMALQRVRKQAKETGDTGLAKAASGE